MKTSRDLEHAHLGDVCHHNEPWSHTKNQINLTYFTGQNRKKTPLLKCVIAHINKVLVYIYSARFQIYCLPS